MASDQSIDLQILDLFRSQAGVITREQAKAVRMSERQIDYRIQKGTWLVVRRGVYRHPLFEIGPEMGVWALSLAGNGYVSHRYAARLHGLEPELRASPEMTVRNGTTSDSRTFGFTNRAKPTPQISATSTGCRCPVSSEPSWTLPRSNTGCGGSSP